MNITIDHDNDGFGAQMMGIISAIAYAKFHEHTYYHTPRKNIKLVGIEEPQNAEIDKINEFLNTFMKNLGINLMPSEILLDGEGKPKFTCEVRPHFHDEIYYNGSNYYTKEFNTYLRQNYPLTKPNYYENMHNIAIHIRRGSDIDSPSQRHNRWIDSNVYNCLIDLIHVKYPNSIIHVFSWGDPEIEIKPFIVFHSSNSGSTFLDDYNALVWADILVVGSSTFSLSAALINNNKIIIDGAFYKLNGMYIPNEWMQNFKEFYVM
jgi:hypothetical protein